MGAIWFKRAELIGATSDTVGYKAGLALSRTELADYTVGIGIDDWWTGDDDQQVRVRSEEFEQAIEQLLYSVGNISTPSVIRPDIALFHRYKGDPTDLATVQGVLRIVKALAGPENAIDPQLLIQESKAQFGESGERVSREFIDGLELYEHVNPWKRVRRKPWKDVADLKDLFDSASLETQYGNFIDQRYIDYLASNSERLDEIHWRKFEALTAEYFVKEGWKVELGPGGNDDGVDVRVWRAESDPTAPPAILVQCKRQKEKVGKVVVKAMWADVIAEKAESGLIVTTSALAPGAAKVSAVREYPVRQADRKELRKWLETMRTPGTGAFLSE